MLVYLFLIAYCLLFISWRLRRPYRGNADETEGIFGFCRTRVGCGPASKPTLIKALCRTCPVVGRRTNKVSIFLQLCEEVLYCVYVPMSPHGCVYVNHENWLFLWILHSLLSPFFWSSEHTYSGDILGFEIITKNTSRNSWNFLMNKMSTEQKKTKPFLSVWPITSRTRTTKSKKIRTLEELETYKYFGILAPSNMRRWKKNFKKRIPQENEKTTRNQTT